MLKYRSMTIVLLLFILVILPATVGFCLYVEYLGGEPGSLGLRFWRERAHRVFRGELAPGDFLIYRKLKTSTRPGRRALHVQASQKGDDYYYEVDKYWAVSDVLEDGRLVAVTRTGKRLYLMPTDERLRKAGWLARTLRRGRFPSV
jgi:hypothetical protein